MASRSSNAIPPRNWELQDSNSEYRRTKWSRRGRFGKKYLVDNCHEIEFSEHINGSGSQTMNGSKRWPTLNIKISFLEGDERMRFIMAEKIAELINEILPTPTERE